MTRARAMISFAVADCAAFVLAQGGAEETKAGPSVFGVPFRNEDTKVVEESARLFAAKEYAKAEALLTEAVLITKKDDRGRPLEARTVRYRATPTGHDRAPSLEQVLGDEVIRFEHAP